MQRGKRKAVAEGRTLTALIEEGLCRGRVEAGADGAIHAADQRGQGGLMPGIDLAAPSALEDSEDLAELG